MFFHMSKYCTQAETNMCPSVISPASHLSLLYLFVFADTKKLHPSPFAHNGGLSPFLTGGFLILFEGSLILLLFRRASRVFISIFNVWMSASFFPLDVKGKNAKIPKGNCQLPSHLKFPLQFHSKYQVLLVTNAEDDNISYQNISK